MAKRFTDSDKWDDPFFADLPNKYKLFWIYLLDKCDHAGIYKVNLRLANFILGEIYILQEVKQVLNGRIQELSPEKWFIPKFISFQYGELDDESRVHKSILKILKKERVSIGCGKGMHTSKDKDKDKDKDNKEVVKGKIPPAIEDVITYCQERNKGVDPHKWFNHYEAKGWLIGKNPMKNWKAAVHTWEGQSAPVCSICNGTGLTETPNGYGGIIRKTCKCKIK